MPETVLGHVSSPFHPRRSGSAFAVLDGTIIGPQDSIVAFFAVVVGVGCLLGVGVGVFDTPVFGWFSGGLWGVWWWWGCVGVGGGVCCSLAAARRPASFGGLVLSGVWWWFENSRACLYYFFYSQ